MAIKITPDEVRSLAGQYRTQASNVEEIISTMTSLLGQLQGVWEGSACEACAAKFEELKPGFQKTVQLIDEIASGLDASAATMQEADETLASQWG